MENSFALKGRILLAASKLFPVLVEKPAPKKQQTNEFEVDKDESLISQALKKSSSNPTNPLIFKSVARFLKNAKCVSYENRIKRPPARVLTSLEGISSQQLQDPEVCLQIAIMCVILQPPEDTTFDGFVKDFASLCKIDGKMILDLVKSSIQTTLPDVSDMDKFRFMQGEPHEEEEEKFEPILRPFDVTFPDETNPMIEISTENTILDENNLNDLFSDDSFYEWRNARYCVANCIDRLDPNSFSFLQ
ncbi:hypothetical protein GPJ56_001942 [Histomonas meleagridis]|uniref:uncharacterized protein n=1 Tax=Histomonas meleagridis TaxID=135588 RepID=UPI003559884D|nr:hypothetical protein GPJ56_001942 [Histomonas meleagridis]KAH0800982.1 hypothetical protein GO595_006298 [Histomonas meleagridis]